jgi:hypothetical protein
MSFSWRSVLRLRLLSQLHQKFGVALEEGRKATDSIRDQIDRQSFVVLWGKMMVAHEDLHAELTDAAPRASSCILIPLDPHLQLISEGFGDLTHQAQQLSFLTVLASGTAA